MIHRGGHNVAHLLLAKSVWTMPTPGGLRPPQKRHTPSSSHLRWYQSSTCCSTTRSNSFSRNRALCRKLGTETRKISSVVGLITFCSRSKKGPLVCTGGANPD